MDLRFVGFSLGALLIVVSLFMLIPAVAEHNHGNLHNAWAFLECALGGFFVGSLLTITNSNFRRDIGVRESFIMTTVSWFAASFLASLPFHFSDINVSYIDAFFESVSGFTTTGSTVFTGLDKMSPGILLWRSLIQFIGGMGVIALAIVFLPFMRVGGMQLFQTESSDRSDKALPRTAKVVTGLFFVYCGLVFACILTYRAVGMSGFDAVNHALTTLATGGYSTHDSSIGYFENPAIHWAVSFFMLLGGLPFVLYLKLLARNDKSLFRDSQVRTALKLALFFIAVLSIWLWYSSDTHFIDALRLVTFNVVSVLTTTGYATTDYLLWGNFAITMFLFITYFGLCSGSTAGGIKVMRFQIVMAQGIIQIKRLIHPSGVFTLSYQGKTVSAATVQSVMVFLTLYVFCNVVLTIFLSLTGLDFQTALSGAATAIANVGPGIGGIIGPAGNFSTLPDAAKLLLCVGMILGRLELMTVLVLFHPSFWKK